MVTETPNMVNKDIHIVIHTGQNPKNTLILPYRALFLTLFKYLCYNFFMVKEKLTSLGGGDWKDQLTKLEDKVNPKILKKEERLKNKAKEAEMAFDYFVAKDKHNKDNPWYDRSDFEQKPSQITDNSDNQPIDENTKENDTIQNMVKETPKTQHRIEAGKIKTHKLIGPGETDKNESGRVKDTKKDISKLSTKELQALGYDILSPEYGNALKREIAERESRIKTKQEKVVKTPESVRFQQLGEEIKKGVDVVVIHGDDATYIELGSGEAKKGIRFSNDMDTSVALYILDQAGIQYKKAELVPKGSKSTDKDPGRYLHVDTSGEAFGIQENVDGRTVDMYADHHQKEKGANTSASDIVYKSLIYSKQLEPNNKLGNLVAFVNSYDNLSYVDEKEFNKEYFEKYWATSMQAIGKEVHIKQLLKWFNENDFNKNTYFTKKDAESEVILKDGSIAKLGDLISKLKTQVKYAGPGIEVAQKRMENKGMPMETQELGKVLYNTLDEEENPINPNKKKNIIPNAFIACKANGYDTYVAYNSKDNRLFINSTTKDLAGVYNRLKAKLQNTVLVRGVMIISINESGVSKEEILKIIGIAPTKEVVKKTLGEVVEAISSGKMKMEDAIAMGFTAEEIIEELSKEGVVEENTETKLANLEKELAEVRSERDTLLANYNARAKAREEEIIGLENKENKDEEIQAKINQLKEEGVADEQAFTKAVDNLTKEEKAIEDKIVNTIHESNIQKHNEKVGVETGKTETQAELDIEKQKKEIIAWFNGEMEKRNQAHQEKVDAIKARIAEIMAMQDDDEEVQEEIIGKSEANLNMLSDEELNIEESKLLARKTEIENAEVENYEKPFIPEGMWTTTPDKTSHINEKGEEFKLGDEVYTTPAQGNKPIYEYMGKITGFDREYAYTTLKNGTEDKRPRNTDAMTKKVPDGMEIIGK
jgi:hypothetical protein